ncbi:MAG: YdjY domain-containing protein [Planctomycetota bacterium]
MNTRAGFFRLLSACVLHGHAACAQVQLVRLSEGLRVNPDAGFVEFDGEVAVEVDVSGELVDYIELFVCSWDSREHESLVVTRVKPSEIHAALLLAGAEPGRPAEFTASPSDRVRSAPTGSPLEVSFSWTREGATLAAAPWSWLVHADTGERVDPPEPAFVFAGSQTIGPRYLADAEGAVAPLVVFDRTVGPGISRGVATIAWNRILSHEASVDEPIWIANKELVPPAGTPVTVRVRVVGGLPPGPNINGQQPPAAPAERDLDGLPDEE